MVPHLNASVIHFLAGSTWCTEFTVYFSETGQEEECFSRSSAVSSFRTRSQEITFIPFLGNKRLYFCLS